MSETTHLTALAPADPSQPGHLFPQPKTRQWAWIAAAVIAALVFVGNAVSDNETTSVANPPGAPATDCIDTAAGQANAQAASDAAYAAAVAADANDLDTMLREARKSAAAWDRVAADSAADSAISSMAHSAAQSMYAGADAAEAGEMGTAANFFTAANTYIQNTTEALRNTSFPAC